MNRLRITNMDNCGGRIMPSLEKEGRRGRNCSKRKKKEKKKSKGNSQNFSWKSI